MSIESLLRAAEAAGFAMASDDNERVGHGSISEWQPAAPPAMPVAKSPKQALSFATVVPAAREPAPYWTRVHFNSFLPAWYAKG